VIIGAIFLISGLALFIAVGVSVLLEDSADTRSEPKPSRRLPWPLNSGSGL
jgi:hypothetical protein